jgi:anti-ECFsigma factor, ChrR
MRLNDDFAARACVLAREQTWQDSPEPGVERIPLDRIGDEVARATSIVRYAAGSRFAEHEHGGGEEVFVISGEFADEQGRYPTGWYLRNPPGSRHAPFSEHGCVLLVKLWQFQPDDTKRVAFDTQDGLWNEDEIPSIAVLPLHQHGKERVRLERWGPGTWLPERECPGGCEIFVLQGRFEDGAGSYPRGAWLRLPPGARSTPGSMSGCLLYVKTGHLPPPILPPGV